MSMGQDSRIHPVHYSVNPDSGRHQFPHVIKNQSNPPDNALDDDDDDDDDDNDDDDVDDDDDDDNNDDDDEEDDDKMCDNKHDGGYIFL
ncbi:hypothetical protein PoB_005732500 [Plakobranchus ocellatus]|uniref:Uncharacterized protein n=1 Tax=Plakobranchus ocellatus TaxID=259542 RepID=A0AAV4CDH4_9GAST|nr:hypothetical protein PoB_005732500 [Plakobranchus ocellatus]